ncbi:pentatricopeptide repeat-containing protein 1, mitochondrial [Drosophila grimshawi]|uniref:GH16176 n=1 Tax=Drosophila grimshawi TaxID=7222 RepID=B4IWZ9_DROGR|nr:pentatricopeptide repeat-containing protein 1, mitochondrial [Drosophila grimshawi]EDV96305.1 GH16176 [Drosophila grimshawi]
MALRFFGAALMPHIRHLQQHTTGRSLHANGILGLQTQITNRCWKQSRLLHVRITDQEAGLQTKRESNRSANPFQDRTLEEQPSEVPRQRMRSKIQRTEQLSRVDEVITTKETVTDFGDPDTFGDAKFSDTQTQDAGDVQEEEFISRPSRHSRKLRTKEYASLIKEHLNARRINEAIAVLEVRMLREDRVKPENYIYNLLISGCAKAGYTRKAFTLYTKMRQRGLKVTGGTYTSLFNACANAPTQLDGLAKARQLRENMLEKGYEPNVKNYNAMIKAYGRCGDIQTAYMLADELLERQLPLNADSFNFLLQACASDEQQGFRHALLTWHKMLKRGISPDFYSFNAMLRCVRDCGFGDLQDMQLVLEQIAPDAVSTKPEQLTATTIPTDSLPTTGNSSAQLELANSPSDQLELPNLLLPRPQLGSLVALTEVTRAHERFLLLGGITGYLELMKLHKVTPNIECFTTILEVIPPTNAAEKQLLSFVRKIGLKADIDFFNILIKKRSMRFDYESAREVLSMIRTAGLQPDIVTYGVLALGCRSQDQARELLQQMQAAGIRMNMPILGAMLRQGCAQKSFAYINEIMQLSLEESIQPNEAFLRHLHNFHRGCARAIDARHPSTKTEAFKKGHSKFCDKYRLFYEEHGLSGLKLEDAVAKLKQRPYAQFKESPVTGLETAKHEQVKRKTKIRKYIKKIKIDELQDDPHLSEPVKRIE